jgi:hypothetical protein
MSTMPEIVFTPWESHNHTRVFRDRLRAGYSSCAVGTHLPKTNSTAQFWSTTALPRTSQ